MTIDLDVLASRLLPVTTHDTPDYAEVSFGDVKSQTMTMEPGIFLMLNALPDLIAAARERDALMEALEEIVCWFGEAPHTFPDWKTCAEALSQMAENALEGRPALTMPEARQALNTGDQS